MLIWAVALGVGVSLGLTLRSLSGPLMVLTVVVAIFGARDARRAWTAVKPIGLAILAAVPLAVMAIDVAAGLSQYIGGPAQDGWSVRRVRSVPLGMVQGHRGRPRAAPPSTPRT